MAIRFDIEPEIAALAERTREFVHDVVIPVELEIKGSLHHRRERRPSKNSYGCPCFAAILKLPTPTQSRIVRQHQALVVPR